MEEDRDTRFSPQIVLECVKKGGNLRSGHCLRTCEKRWEFKIGTQDLVLRLS